MERFIGGVLVNFKSKTFHPIIFKMSPLPGGVDLDYRSQRYKSIGHHTEGFKSSDELKTDLQAQKESTNYKIIFSHKVYGWDGEDIPSAIEFFNWDEEEKVEDIDKLIALVVAVMNVPLPEKDAE